MAVEIIVYRVTEGDQNINVVRNENGNWVMQGPLVDVLVNNGRGGISGAVYTDAEVAQNNAGALLRGLNEFLDLSEELATNNG